MTFDRFTKRAALETVAANAMTEPHEGIALWLLDSPNTPQRVFIAAYLNLVVASAQMAQDYTTSRRGASHV